MGNTLKMNYHMKALVYCNGPGVLADFETISVEVVQHPLLGQGIRDQLLRLVWTGHRYLKI
jgi:hypothetical protein